MSEQLERKINILLVPILLTVSIGMGGWVMAKSASNAEAISALSAVVQAGKEQRLRSESEGIQRDKEIMLKLDELVSRREFEARLLSVEARISECNVAIKALEIRLAKIELDNRK
jgi:hypothetical protein